MSSFRYQDCELEGFWIDPAGGPIFLWKKSPIGIIFEVTGTARGSGIASGNVMSVRAAVYHIAGHELRDMNIIKERYCS